MTAARYWLTSIGSDALLLALFYAWQVENVEQAGNVVVFWCWFIAIVRVLCGMVADKSLFSDKPRPAGFGWYHAVTDVAMISALVWVGFLWLPALYLFGAIMMEGARKREPKEKKVAA